MARRTNDARRLRFLAHYRRWGEVGRAAAYAGVSRSTGSRWMRAARQLVEDRAAEVRKRLDALLDEAVDTLMLDLRPGEGSGCDVPHHVRVQLLAHLTKALGLAAPEKVEVTTREVRFVVEGLGGERIDPRRGRREVAQRPETNGARLLT